MKPELRLLSWKSCLVLSVVVLIILIVLNFYGLYSNKFYFLKPDNYIFPFLTFIHFIFLYVMWFKIHEQEMADIQMRNIEFVMYGILLIYVFKVVNTLYILMSYYDYDNHFIPGTFLPMGFLIIVLQLLLVVLTLSAFKKRKELIGDYKFDNINDNIDSWH